MKRWEKHGDLWLLVINERKMAVVYVQDGSYHAQGMEGSYSRTNGKYTSRRDIFKLVKSWFK